MQPRHASTLRKWPVIAAYWCLQAAVLGLGWPMVFVDWRPAFNSNDIPNGEVCFIAGVYILAITTIQAAFVIPIRRPQEQPGPKYLSAIVAGFAIALLSAFVAWLIALCLVGMGFEWAGPLGSQIWYWPFWTGFGVGLLALPLVVYRFRRGVPVALSIVLAAFLAGIVVASILVGFVAALNLAVGDKIDDHAFALSLATLATLLLSWSVATPLLLRFSRATHPEYFLSRLANTLFLGTLIEAAAIIPFDVMIRKKSNCYCTEGTFFALTALWSVGFLILGPAVYLLPLGRRRKRLMNGRCPVCGYDLRSSPNAPACPECGTGWRDAAP